MELIDFLCQTQNDVRTREGSPFAELTFADVVMQHMSEFGMTFDPQICHYSARVGNANLRLSGFAISEEADQLDLFVSLYSGANTIQPIARDEIIGAFEQCMQFLKKCVEGRLLSTMDESHDAYTLALTIKGSYANLDQIRIYVLTDRQRQTKGNFKSREIGGKIVKLEVMDIERLHRHWSEGKPRDELIVNFEEVSGSPLPCVLVQDSTADYDYALTAIPGEALRFIYEKYGPRLLEANVRSFLSVTGKVNKGIKETLINKPERFMAYNNGIVVVTDEARIGKTTEGGPGILWLKGMQIVNGGQTTASIYFTKRKNNDIDLSRVRVPAKVIILRSDNTVAEEALISDVSRYANTQNRVNLSDLSANKPFHIELEKLSWKVFCPDSEGRWFYERAAGSYNTMLSREGTTTAKLRKLKDSIPSSRKITKTELAKYLNAWDLRPHLVSLGAQKNFERFMDNMKQEDGNLVIPLPDVATYKAMIAKAILFKKTHSLVRPMFPAFQANVVAYLVSVLSNNIGHRIKLERIWEKQDISTELRHQLTTWAKEVNDILHHSSNGRMISEWAKRQECWDTIRTSKYSPVNDGIPELR